MTIVYLRGFSIKKNLNISSLFEGTDTEAIRKDNV